MRWTPVISCLLLLAGLLLIGPACEEEEEDEPSVADWLSRGKEKLIEGDGAGAYLAFQEALEQESGNLEARYGVILSDILQFSDTVELLTALLTSVTDEEVPAEEAAAVCVKLDECEVLARTGDTYLDCINSAGFGYDAETRSCIIASQDCDVLLDRCLGLYMPPDRELCSSSCVRFASCGYLVETEWSTADCINRCAELFLAGELECFISADSCAAGSRNCFPYYGETITALVDEFWSPIAEEMAWNIQAIQGHPDFLFELEQYTFTLLAPFFQPSFSGYHDESDLFFFASNYAGIDALFSIVQGLNLNLNPLFLMNLGFNDLLDLGVLGKAEAQTDELTTTLLEIDSFLELILNDPIYRDFLTLSENGEEYMENAGVQIGMIFGHLATMIEMVAAETDDQTDDVIRYRDLNGDGIWNDPEPLIIPGIAEMEYQLAWIVHDLLVALKVDFTDGYAFQLEVLIPLFDFLGLDELSLAIRLMDLAGIDSLELGRVFREPDPAGLRPLLSDVRYLIQVMIDNAAY